VSAVRAGEEGNNVAGRARPAGHAEVRYLARHMVMGLTVQFLLGMAVTLIGQPSQTTGDARIASTVFLAAHVLVSAGMVIGAAQAVRAAAYLGSPWRSLAIWGAAAIAATLAAGVLTTITKSNWWSYAMATGFIASLLTYGSLLLPARTPAPHPNE
jgi:hypothetical protein